jgi:hypothetical protein
MLETRSSNTMDTIGKAGSLRLEKTATQIQWVVRVASLVVAATEAALVVEVDMEAVADLAVAEALEEAMEAAEEVATVVVDMLLVVAALWLRPAGLGWKPRTPPILSPTSQRREARRIRSSTSET